MNGRELLQKLMAEYGENANSLAAATRVPQPTIFRFLKGEAKEPRRSTLEPIAKHYGVSVEMFFSSKVSLSVDHKERTQVAIDREPKKWPFPGIDPKKFFGLPERLRGVIEGRAQEIIEEYERKSEQFNPTVAPNKGNPEVPGQIIEVHTSLPPSAPGEKVELRDESGDGQIKDRRSK